ncbi:tubby-related protein 2 isoform X2 [Macrotis lagotis]|uniref:tubby-related protein 2 isoform X2 n=1 Tax=Macrotis lagotis TaxID=92651 RepID=UPI003D6917F5
MAQDCDLWRKHSYLGDELAILRQQKLEQQWRLFEKKQRRKRQEPLMVQANPDAFLQPRRPRRREGHDLGESGPGNPFLLENVPEAHLRAGAHSLQGSVNCGGDCGSECTPLQSLGGTDSSDPELEEVSVEDSWVSPLPGKELSGTRRRGWTARQRPGRGDTVRQASPSKTPVQTAEEDTEVTPEDLESPSESQTPEDKLREHNQSGSQGSQEDLKEDDNTRGPEEKEEAEEKELGDCHLKLEGLQQGGDHGDSVSSKVGSEPQKGSPGWRGRSKLCRCQPPSPEEKAQEEVEDKAATVALGSSEADGGTGAGDFGKEPPLPPPAPSHLPDQNMEDYVLRPGPRNWTVQCSISRDKRGVDKGMFPFYYLYLEAPDGKKHFLLAGRKRKRSRTSNYLISLDPNDLSRDGENFIGKVRSNVLGTKFTIFDNGVNPERKSFLPASTQIREELGAVCYETNVLGFRGPRKMTIVIPDLDPQNQRIKAQPQTESLLSRLQRGASQGLVLLHNKAPAWSEESGAYILNFHGRVTKASVKNFQIVHPKDPDYLVLQFGRVAPDSFTMDFRFPLCPLQAFAICLSSFDGKLASPHFHLLLAPQDPEKEARRVTGRCHKGQTSAGALSQKWTPLLDMP